MISSYEHIESVRKIVQSHIELSNPDKNGSYYQCLCLGAGVQSSTLFLMNLHGLIKPQALFAVFADTQNEKKVTYDQLDYLDAQGDKFGFPKIIRSTGGSIVQGTLNRNPTNKHIKDKRAPYHIGGNFSTGRLRRFCTDYYKTRVTNNVVKKISGYTKHNRWIGFSTDEIERANTNSRRRHVILRFPLLEKRLDRSDCINWLIDNKYNVPSNSSCIMCPYQSKNEWIEMKEKYHDEFEWACNFDEKIRNIKFLSDDELVDLHSCLPILPPIEPKTEYYLHYTKSPLRNIDTQKENQTENLDKQEECTGGCWL